MHDVVHRYSEIEYMTRSLNKLSPFNIVVGGDTYLNEQTTRDLMGLAQKQYPEAELMNLDAGETDQYGFEEAVSPSLLSDNSIVHITHLQDADEALLSAMLRVCKEASASQTYSSIVIAQHEGGNKGKHIIDQLAQVGAAKQQVPDLKKAEAKLNFVIACFERANRRVEPAAAQQLVSVLGEKTGELAAMCAQLCFDFEDNPITLRRVNQYLTTNPQVTGFLVADKAIAGDTSGAIIAARAAVEQGIDPIALIGALAMKLRTLAKASAVKAGTLSQAEAKTNPWVLKNNMRQLSGWSSQGLSNCIQTLAWADEACKTNAGNPQFAVERAIELISRRGS